MRIVFRPVQTEAANPASTVNELVFVAALDDKGDPIPDEGLSWVADGEHEALDVSPLCANCKAHVVCPTCVEMGAKLPIADRVRAWFFGRDLSKLSPNLSASWFDDLAKFISDPKAADTTMKDHGVTMAEVHHAMDTAKVAQAKRLMLMLLVALRLQDDDHDGEVYVSKRRGSHVLIDGDVDLLALANALLDAGVTLAPWRDDGIPTNPGDVDPNAGRKPIIGPGFYQD